MISSLFILLCVIANSLCTPAISLSQCKSSDDDCILNAVRAAFHLILEENAAIGAESMDPMFQDVIEGNLSILKFKLFNTTVTGYKACTIPRAKFDEEAETLQMDLDCPRFTLAGQYDIKGRLIVLPVEGNGDYNLETNRYRFICEMDLKTIIKDGKQFRSIKSFKIEAEPLEKVNFEFRNLFNGQKDLADAVLKFANENWKEVAKEVQEPVFKANIKKIVKNANKYLKTLPSDQYIGA